MTSPASSHAASRRSRPKSGSASKRRVKPRASTPPKLVELDVEELLGQGTAAEIYDRAALAGVERWRDDPALFASEVLDTEVWDRQRELLDKAAGCAMVLERRSKKGKRKLAVRSGHKVGKSTTAAILALWWYCTRDRARVVMTSASARQIKAILWKELRRLYRRARWPIGGDFAKDPETGLQYPDGREVVGFSTDEPEKMAGISGPAVLYLCDEASGIGEEIFEAIEGNAAGGALVILFSNPTKTSGAFFRAFHEEAGEWECVQISSEEAAAVVPPIPGLATREWVDEKKRVWGVDSPLYAVRVRGDFPKQADNAVISLHMVTEANKRWHAMARGPMPKDRLRIGVDVARYGGDETAMAWRRGLFVSRPQTLLGKDETEVAAAVMKMVIDQRRLGEEPIVNVDVTGLGAAVFALLDAQKGIEVHAIHAQDPPTDAGDEDADAQFHRMRDELWWRLRLFLEGGGAIPDDSKLVAECVAPTYKIDPAGKIRISSKDEMKKVLKRSPDRADGVCLAVFEPGSSAEAEKVMEVARSTKGSKKKADDREWKRAAGVAEPGADPFDDGFYKDEDEEDDDEYFGDG